MLLSILKTKNQEKQKNLKLLNITLEKALLKKVLELITFENKTVDFFSKLLHEVEQYFVLQNFSFCIVKNKSIVDTVPNISQYQSNFIKSYLPNLEKGVSKYNSLIIDSDPLVYLMKIKIDSDVELVINFDTNIKLISDDVEFILKYLSHILFYSYAMHKNKKTN